MTMPRRPPFAPAAAPAPATALAASPLARHRAFVAARAAGARAALRPPPLERVLRRAPQPVVRHASVLLQAWHLWQAHRHLHVQAITQRQAPPVQRQLLVRVEAPRGAAQAWQARAPVQRLLLAAAPRAGGERTVGAAAPALARRAEAALPLVLRRTEARAAYPRVGTTLARPPAARSEAAPPRTQGADALLAQAAGHAPPRAARAAPADAPDWTLPARELARVTASVSQQVIGQLERRALSLRERSGRW